MNSRLQTILWLNDYIRPAYGLSWHFTLQVSVSWLSKACVGAAVWHKILSRIQIISLENVFKSLRFSVSF